MFVCLYDWLYIYSLDEQAYHDIATYNAAEGTGGFDGSIRYEMQRPEVSVSAPRRASIHLSNHLQNLGQSFRNTELFFVTNFANRYVSGACFGCLDCAAISLPYV
jgi:hypothetical protein